jgi:hypothetical protein
VEAVTATIELRDKSASLLIDQGNLSQIAAGFALLALDKEFVLRVTHSGQVLAIRVGRDPAERNMSGVSISIPKAVVEDLAMFFSEMVLGQKSSTSHFDIELRSGRGDVFDLVIEFADTLFKMETITPEEVLAKHPPS